MKKRSISIILFLALILLLFSCGPVKEGETSINTDAGELSFSAFSAVTLDGKPIDQSVFEGKKLTMINVWATFCGPCIREMPDLGRLSTAYGEEFQIIGIPLDVVDYRLIEREEELTKAKEIITEADADYLHLIPSGSLSRLFLSEVQSVPTTVFVDGNGNQIGEIYVGAMSEKEWAEIIEALLAHVK